MEENIGKEDDFLLGECLPAVGKKTGKQTGKAISGTRLSQRGSRYLVSFLDELAVDKKGAAGLKKDKDIVSLAEGKGLVHIGLGIPAAIPAMEKPSGLTKMRCQENPKVGVLPFKKGRIHREKGKGGGIQDQESFIGLDEIRRPD